MTLPIPASDAPQAVVAAQAVDFSGNISMRRAVTLSVQIDTLPQVSIVAPVAGSLVASGGRVTVTVQADDDRGLSRLVFQARGAASAGSNLTVSPVTTTLTSAFSFNVPANAAPGDSIELKAVATDNGGQTGPTTSTLVWVSDATPPVAGFVAPANLSKVAPGATVDVRVNVSDNGPVASVQLRALGAAVISETQVLPPGLTAASLTFRLPISPAVDAGDLITLTVQAQDVAGNLSTPVTRRLTVSDVVSPLVSIDTFQGVLPPASPDEVGRVIQGTSITATVVMTDNVGVNSVALQAKGAFTATTTQAVTPPTANANRSLSLTVPVTAPVGSHARLVATATDAEGNVGNSLPVTITILADVPPTVSVSRPASGSLISTNRPFAVRVEATDDVGVTQVSLVASGVVTSTQSIALAVPAAQAGVTATVNVPADAALGGIVTLVIGATDTRGQLAASTVVTFVVGIDGTPPSVQVITPTVDSVVVPGSVVQVQVRAQDNGAVKAINLSASGAVSSTQRQPFLSDHQTVTATFPITVPSSATANQQVQLAVQAEDASGNQSPVTSISLAVRDVFSPTVDLTVLGGATEAIRGTTITFTVSVTDEVAVGSVGFVAAGPFDIANQESVAPQPVASAVFTLSVPANLPHGTLLTLVGTGADLTGNRNTSAPVNLVVVADDAPSVSLVTPPDGATVATGSTISATVMVTDDIGLIRIVLAADRWCYNNPGDHFRGAGHHLYSRLLSRCPGQHRS